MRSQVKKMRKPLLNPKYQERLHHPTRSGFKKGGTNRQSSKLIKWLTAPRAEGWLALENRPERLKAAIDVFWAGRFTHEAHAPNLAFHRTEPGANLDVMVG